VLLDVPRRRTRDEPPRRNAYGRRGGAAALASKAGNTGGDTVGRFAARGKSRSLQRRRRSGARVRGRRPVAACGAAASGGRPQRLTLSDVEDDSSAPVSAGAADLEPMSGHRLDHGTDLGRGGAECRAQGPTHGGRGGDALNLE